MQGHLIPWWDFQPDWKGWRSLGLSPDTIGQTSTVRDEFLKRFANSIVSSVGASFLAVVIGSLAAYGLSRFSYRFGPMRNKDIAFFFLSQLILPPVVLALPFLVLYKELALLDTRIGLILLYTLMVLPIVIWVMRDQFGAIPIELEEAALVDGLSVWGAFLRIVLPLALPGMVAGIHSLAGAVLERVLLRRPADQHGCEDPAGHGGEPDRLPRDQLVVHGGTIDGGDRAAGGRRDRARTLHHQGHDRRRGQMMPLGEEEPCSRNLDPLLNADVLYALRAMGHGDDLIVCDTNFPADSVARQTVLSKLLQDRWRQRRTGDARRFSRCCHWTRSSTMPRSRMEIVGQPDQVPPVQAEVQARNQSRPKARRGPWDRSSASPSTSGPSRLIAWWRPGETRFYGCFLFKKGVIPPA